MAETLYGEREREREREKKKKKKMIHVTCTVNHIMIDLMKMAELENAPKQLTETREFYTKLTERKQSNKAGSLNTF